MTIDNINLSDSERLYLDSVLKDGNMPKLEEIWKLMDVVWEEYHCNPEVMDDRITRFYKHPVWVLNGLYIEQDAESLRNRREFAEFVARLQPKRVADYGGGYGTLARMIGKRCPETEVHVVEPYPPACAKSLAEATANVRYVPTLIEEYDILIASDVFEHVPEPLRLVEATAEHLKGQGIYMMANYFWPVVHCHLPANFHFRYSWEQAMSAMNLHPKEVFSYGRAYHRTGTVSYAAARNIEQLSRKWFWLLNSLPYCLQRPVAKLMLSSILG